MTYRALLLDFYGTLAESPDWGPSWEEVLAEFGIGLPDAVRDRWWGDGIDGVEHDEHSQSRDHYVAWQRARMSGLLSDCGVPDESHDPIIDRLHSIGAQRRIFAYDEVTTVLAALRDRGLTLAICSNWDWDLAEAVEAAGLLDLVDVLVSSAWVGARKPHPRIYAHTLERIGVAPEEVLFVGDTWGPDVDGPLAAGMTPVYVRRAHRERDLTAPADAHDHQVARLPDLHGLLDLLDPALTGRP
jgi:putative hydrolase of the HAD superfamily